uniref:Uncharacterized protein n=1 Tax=Arundo donax TaxID=35708 RepID=A0A0A9A4F9_ARUDO
MWGLKLNARNPFFPQTELLRI